MVSQLTQTTAAVVGVTLLGAGLAIGWSWVEPVEPSFEPEAPQELFGTRVFYETKETKLSTEDQDLPVDGHVVFDPLQVRLTNVTYVTVTLHAQVDGFALRDEYSLQVRAPDGDEHEGTWQGSLNANGYRTSTTVIDDWRRAPQPQEEIYATTNASHALALDAANHTDERSIGAWASELQVNLPGLPSRSGNASLTFTFVHYEAIATLLEHPPDEGFLSDCLPEETATSECTERPPATNSSSGSQRGETEDVSRTFITQRDLARSVDRNPRPDGPL